MSFHNSAFNLHNSTLPLKGCISGFLGGIIFQATLSSDDIHIKSVINCFFIHFHLKLEKTGTAIVAFNIYLILLL